MHVRQFLVCQCVSTLSWVPAAPAGRTSTQPSSTVPGWQCSCLSSFSSRLIHRLHAASTSLCRSLCRRLGTAIFARVPSAPVLADARSATLFACASYAPVLADARSATGIACTRARAGRCSIHHIPCISSSCAGAVPVLHVPCCSGVSRRRILHVGISCSTQSCQAPPLACALLCLLDLPHQLHTSPLVNLSHLHPVSTIFHRLLAVRASSLNRK